MTMASTRMRRLRAALRPLAAMAALALALPSAAGAPSPTAAPAAEPPSGCCGRGLNHLSVGTVHLLDPGIEWRETGRVMRAIDDAKQLGSK